MKPQTTPDRFCQAFPAHLEDLDLCGVRGADVETFQIGLKHPLHSQPETIVSPLPPHLAKATSRLW